MVVVAASPAVVNAAEHGPGLVHEFGCLVAAFVVSDDADCYLQSTTPYGAICGIIQSMFFKVMGIACDGESGTCNSEIQTEGTDAIMSKVMSQAREEGWAVSSAGHYCPQHRRRKS